MDCAYCDESEKVGIEKTINQVMEKVLEIDREEGPHSFVSLTGGEPLLHIDFLKPFMERLKGENFRILLETNGVLWQALEEVIGWCDTIAMDMKPASATKRDNVNDEHKRFLEVAKTNELFVKIIISKETDVNEIEEQFRLVAKMNPQIPVILTPVSTEIEGHEDPILMELLTNIQRMGLHYLKDLRIVPRLHKILKIS